MINPFGQLLNILVKSIFSFILLIFFYCSTYMLLFLGAKIDKIFDMTKFWDDFNTTLTFKIWGKTKKRKDCIGCFLSFIIYIYMQ